MKSETFTSLSTGARAVAHATAICAVTLAFAAVGDLARAACRNFETDIRWIGGVGIYGGTPRDVDLFTVGASSYAVIGMESLADKVVDITNPAAPVVVSVINGASGGWRTAISGTRAVAAQSNGAGVYDLSNPASPQLIGVAALAEPAGEVLADADYAYVLGTPGGFFVVRLTGSGAPVSVGACWVGGTNSRAERSGSYVYVANSEGLSVVNITNANAPIRALKLSGFFTDVTLRDTHLYAAATNAVSIYSLANPAAPALVNTLTITGAKVVEAESNRLLVGTAASWSVYDLTNPTSPLLLTSLEDSGANEALLVGSTAYITNAGMHVFELRSETTASPLSTIATGANMGRLASGPGAQLLRNEGSHLAIYSVVDPAAPVLLTTHPVSEGITALATQGNYAFVALNSPLSLRVYDISVPGVPIAVTTLPQVEYTGQLVVSGSRLYAHYLGNSLTRVFDISDPTQPEDLGAGFMEVADWLGHPDGFAANGNIVCCVGNLDGEANSAGLYDMSTPSNAILLWNAAAPVHHGQTGWYYVGLGDDRAVFGDAYGISVYNITTPTSPVLLGSLDLGDVSALRVQDGLAYVGVHGGFRVVDLEGAPTVIATVGTNPWIDEIFAVGDYIYTSDFWNLRTYAGPCPAADAPEPLAVRPRFTSWPNPSTGAVTLAFNGPSGATGEIGVFDPTGRRVRSLTVGAGPSKNTLPWNGRDESGRLLPAGIYLLQLKGAAQTETLRQILIR